MWILNAKELDLSSKFYKVLTLILEDHSSVWHLACVLTWGDGLFPPPPPLAEGSGPELQSELPRYPLKPHESPKIVLSLKC